MSDTLWVAVLGMIGLTLSTLGVALANASGSRKRGKDAAEDREHIKAALQPQNGYDSIGQGISGVEEKLGKIDDRLQEGDERFGRIEELLDRRGEVIQSLETKTAETLALVGDSQDLMKRYITAWTPLSDRAVKEWGADGKRRKGKKK